MNSLYGLIGEKLGHSFSPQIQSLILRKLGISGDYKLFEMGRDDLKEKINEFKDKGYNGINVTIPYKVDVIKYLDEISNEALKIGAVNTICFKDNKVIGYNTDYFGFGMLLDRFNIKTKGQSAVILGTGGAAKAVSCRLMDNGIKEIAIISRDKDNAQKKFESLNIMDYDDLYKSKNFDIIINCTPCGMYPNADICPIKPEAIRKFQVAVDLIYNPKETVFLRQAILNGLNIANGMYMLIGQAVKSQEIWNDIRIDTKIIDDIYCELKFT